MSSADPAHAARLEHLVDLRRYAEAHVALSAALAATPDDAGLHGLMARALLGLGRAQDALVHANRMVGLVPDREWGHRLAAVVLLELDQPAEAARAARTAVRIAPLTWQTHHVLALSASRLPGGVAEARTAGDTAVSLAPGQAGAHFAVGLAAQRRGDVATARVAYERALAIEPDHAEALNNLTNAAGHRRLSRAARGYAGSLRADPQARVSRRNLEVIAVRFVRRLYVMALAGIALGALVSGASGGRVGPASLTVAALIVAVVAGYTTFELRDVPSGLRRYVAGRVVRDPFNAVTAALTVAMLALALVTSLVPDGFGVALGLLPLLGVVNLGLAVVSRSRRRTR